MKLFGTSGIRGKDDFFTPEFCIKIIKAFCRYLTEKQFPKKIVFGMDIRTSSPSIVQALITGAHQKGFELIFGGIVPTPGLNVFAKHHQSGGIMVTGSHLKGGYNGIKFFLGNREVINVDEQTIEQYYEEQKKESVDASALIELPQVDSACRELYKKALLSKAKDYTGITIVVDAGFGTQQYIMPDVLPVNNGCTHKLHCATEGFTGVDTEMSDGFDEVKKKVVSVGANLGVIYDSDGDRSIYVDHEGTLVSGDVIGALIAKHLTFETIVAPINTSSVIDHIGKKIIRTKVGSPPIVEIMLRQNLPFGFEGNGGLIFADHIYSRDGGITTVYVLNIMKETGKSLKELVAELPMFFIEKDKSSLAK